MKTPETWPLEIRKHPEAWIAPIIRSGELQLATEILQDHPYLLHCRPSRNSTLLMEAAYFKRNEIVDVLLDMGAKLDFISAVALGRTAAVAAMIADWPQILRKGTPESFSALHIATSHAGPDMLE